MHKHSKRVFAAVSVVAVAVLATASAGSTNPATTHPVSVKQGAQLVQLAPDRGSDEVYVWIVNGTQRGLAMR